jgi:amidophosphoribosyltransferase
LKKYSTLLPRDDKFRDECGVFAVSNHPEASRITYLGLYALQHRGQESAGIVSLCDGSLDQHHGMGLVADVFDDDAILKLRGNSAIGHVRYSTTGESHISNAQPIVTDSRRGLMALGHNGNLLRTNEIRRELELQGAIFRSTTDSEVMLHLLARSDQEDTGLALREVFGRASGAFSLVMATSRSIWAARDPYGVRPLCLGQLDDGWVVASETCAFDLIGAKYIRDIEPGEAVQLKGPQMRSLQIVESHQSAHCIFEHVYFSRPDSTVFGKSVHSSRHAMGKQLAKESTVDADLIVPVPDSGVTSALGYANEAGLPFQVGLIRNHYVGRTFIEPKQSIRHFGVKIKLNPVREVLQGKRVIVIDDSIVRGTTSQKIVEMLRNAGASEVHMRVASPPTVSPCHYGIDTPTYSELIANQMSVEEIRDFINADSLAYLSIEGMKTAVGAKDDFCTACFDRRYPIPDTPRSAQKGLFDLDETPATKP